VERFVALDTSSEERGALLVFLSGYFGGCLGIALGRRGGRLERGMLDGRESGRVRGWECDVMVRLEWTSGCAGGASVALRQGLEGGGGRVVYVGCEGERV
jgi:hypothetical protein